MIKIIGTLCLVSTFLTVNCYEGLLVDELRWEFLNLEDELWSFVLNCSRYNNDDTTSVLMNAFHQFDQRIQQMPQDILYGLQVARQAQPFLFLFSDLRVIDDLYDKFRRCQSLGLNKQKSDDDSYQQELMISYLIDDILYDPKSNLNKTILNIYQQMFVSKSDTDNMASTIFYIFDIITDNDYICKKFDQPPQQVFYNLYNTIALAELKSYILIQFSYLAQRLKEKGNYTDVSLLARKEFQERNNLTMMTFKGAMNATSGKLWKCDPKQHILGETYDKLTALIQGHIENEVDMNYGGTCKQNCDAYPLSKNYGCYDKNSDYCKKRKPCAGKILNCRFVESHMTACISPTYSSRRYEYIQFKSGKMMGKKTWCDGRNINSWFRWFVHCSYCVCLCDQEGRMSDRYFNLRPVMADVANNRVVTGLRIIKRNRIIHLQIQEGKLLPYGYIDTKTVRWVPVDNYKITDRGVQNEEDFHTMNAQTRTLLLDDLKPVEEGQLITGVKFEFIDNQLRFQIHVTGFDFKTGILSNDAYYIYGTEQRHKINIYDTDIPIESPKSAPIWNAKSYIEFTHTSFDKDAAQTTVPFFDTQPVAANPATPLKGAGIYYKGYKGYGGFIAPQITTYDFSKHLNINFPKQQLREDIECSPKVDIAK